MKRLPLYSIVVTCVVIRKKSDGPLETLILKRSEKEEIGPGLWTIPGEKVEACDWTPLKQKGSSHALWVHALQNACTRELKEETALNARRFNFLAGSEVIFLLQDSTPAMVFLFWIRKSRWGVVRLGKDNVAYRWVRPRELKHYRFIGNVKQGIIRVLKGAAKRQKV